MHICHCTNRHLQRTALYESYTVYIRMNSECRRLSRERAQWQYMHEVIYFLKAESHDLKNKRLEKSSSTF